MENGLVPNISQHAWSKQDLQCFLALALQGKGRHEIAQIMQRPFSEVVRAALKYSIILPA